MKITHLFKCSQEEFENKKSRDEVTLICQQCKQEYNRVKKSILSKYSERNSYPTFCSKRCQGNSLSERTSLHINCTNCGKEVIKKKCEVKKVKNNFCTQSCATSYNNKHKKYGTRRSKFEIQLENQIKLLYPSLDVLYSDKTAIGSELDLHIQSLKLAFEIQGIFHYQPIYGEDKLRQIQKNDLEKVKRCKEEGITLIHIDISQLNRCTRLNVIPYNKLIFKEIDNHFK